MRDQEMVAAIVAGDRTGLAAAYDRYAPPLYAYCSSILSEPADAGDAVQDTFIIAAAKLSALRDPSRLRPWLYSVARHECLRRQRSSATASLDEAADVTDEQADPVREVEQAERRELVRAAMSGLSPGDREIIELNLGHELSGADLADVLGVSRNQAHAQASRARLHFEAALGALLVARSGQKSCAELAKILDGWDGQLSVLLRKRVSRHIGHCDVCGERRRRELSPAALLSLVPLAVVVPAALRQQVLGLAADVSPAGIARRLAIVHRAGQLASNGFPPPTGRHWLAHGHLALARGSLHSARNTAAAAGAAVVITGSLAVGILPHHQPGQDRGGHHGQAAAPGTPGQSPGSPGQRGGSAPGEVAVTPSASALPAAPGGTPSGPPASPGRPAPSPRPSPPLAPVLTGSLSVSPANLGLSLSLSGLWEGTFTLTAVGGAVTGYQITIGPAFLGDLTLSKASGSLTAGQSTQVTVHALAAGLFSTATLTVNPGDLSVRVTYLGL